MDATAIIMRWRCPPDTSLTRFWYNSCSSPNSSKQANSRDSEKGLFRLAFSPKGSCTTSFIHSKGSANSCGIHAICLLKASTLPFSNKRPFKVMLPFIKGVNPKIALSKDVFPHPEGPEILAISPRFRCRLNPEKSTLLS